MDTVNELDRAFRKLLFDREYRATFTAQGASQGLSARVRTVLSTVDVHELDKLAKNVLRGVASGRLGGCRIEQSFKGTLDELATAFGGGDEVIARFLASGDFLRVEAVGNMSGVGVPEAFHDFVLALGDADARLRRTVQHEYIVATVRALAITDKPAFNCESPLIRRYEGGVLAVLDTNRALAGSEDRPDQPFTVVGTGGRFWCGPTSEVLAAAVLAVTKLPPGWARDVEDRQPEAVVKAGAILRSRGLL